SAAPRSMRSLVPACVVRVSHGPSTSTVYHGRPCASWSSQRPSSMRVSRNRVASAAMPTPSTTSLSSVTVWAPSGAMFREITTKIARSGPTAHLRPGAEASGDRDSIVTGDTLEGGGALTASERLGAGLRGRRRRATPSPRAVLPLASSSPRRVLLGLGQRSREQRAGRPLLDADGLLGAQAHDVLRDEDALEAHAHGEGGHEPLGALGAEPACDRPHGLGQVA